MKILTYRVDDHDSNFCYFDGETVKYFSPERHHGIKHYGYFPLRKYKFDPHQPEEIFDIFEIDKLDLICEVPDDPRAKSTSTDFTYWVNPNLLLIRTDENIFNLDVPTYYIEHHWAHANSLWPISGKTEYSVVYDGVGVASVHASIFKGNERVAQIRRSECTSVCLEFAGLASLVGIEASCGLDLAGKIMGYQSFGNKKNADKIFKNLYESYTLETSPDIGDLYSHLIDDYDQKDIAMAYQKWVEVSFIDWVKKYVPTESTVSFTGGLAQNVLLNYQLSKVYPNLVIPPHVNDVGLSIGAMGCIMDHYGIDTPKVENFPFTQTDESPTETPTRQTIATIARLLSLGKIVAWYQGNGEIGPRALGNRSILMDPTVKNGKDIINERVKKRENFRPFGAAVMLDYVSDWFEWDGETPYMLHAVPVKSNRLKSVTHADGTCRIQTVKDGVFYDLLKEFYNIKKVPVLLNTSLNLAGKPIAGNISDAEKLFEDADIDVFCYGNTILYK